MSLFSFLSGGKKKTKSESETNQNVNTQSSGSNVQGNTQTSSTKSTQTGTKSGTTTGKSTTTGGQSGTSTSTGTQSQSGTTKTFNDASLAELNQLFASFGSALDSKIDQNSDLLAAATAQLDGFDPTAYVNDLISSAQTRFKEETDPALAAFSSAIGGNEESNSMAALLKGRLESSNAARVAGVAAEATGQAQDIVRRNIESAANVGAISLNDFLNIGNLLKAGETSSEGQTAGQQTASQNQQTTGEQSNTQTSEESSTDSVDQVTSLLDLILQMTQEQSKQDATVKSKGSSTESNPKGLFGVLQDFVNLGQ